jgi:hypothetical protein
MDTRRHFIQEMLAGLVSALVVDAPATNPAASAGGSCTCGAALKTLGRD